MKALVTGGTGFLGRRLCTSLKEDGWQVTAYGRNEAQGMRLQEQGVQFYKGNLEDAADVETAMYGASHVFHCGALASPWGRYKHFYNANVIATQNVVDACHKHDIDRLVHVSTPSIYVAKNNKLGIKESDPLPDSPINYYAQTKLLAEGIVDEASENGLETITIRPQAIFGPEDPNIFPRMIRACRRGYLPIIGAGTNLIDITYIDNVVDAMRCCITAPAHALGQKYNITNGEPQGLYNLLTKIFDKIGMPLAPKHIQFSQAWHAAKWLERLFKTFMIGSEPPLTQYAVLAFGLSRTLSIEKAIRDLGYQPKIPVEEGIDRFARWWRMSHENE